MTLYRPTSPAETVRVSSRADRANIWTNILFSFSLVNAGSVALAARIRLPPVEAGLNPAKEAVRHMMVISPSGRTPTCSAMEPTVGTMVGHTTPMAELNQERSPADSPWMATALFGS